MAARTRTDMEGYLKELEEALEALGPDEAREVVAEIRALMAEALADAEGDTVETFAGFGDPTSLAAGILQERGVHAGTTRVPAAPAGVRMAALVVDAVVWLGALILGYALVAAPAAAVLWGSSGRVVAIGVMLLVAVLAVAGSIWWWMSWRRRPGTPTAGMALTGLRRIRVAGHARVARVADIPGAARPGRIGPALKLIGAVGLAVLLISSLSQGSGDAVARDQRAVLSDVSTSASLVSEAYRMVLTDQPEVEVAGLFAPIGGPVLTDLIERRRAGLIDSYALREVGADPSGRTVAGLFAAGGGRTSVPVVVCEYDGTQETGCYRYQVVGEVTTDLARGATGTWWIESATKVG